MSCNIFFQDSKTPNCQILFRIIQNPSFRSEKLDSPAVYFVVSAANKLKSRFFLCLDHTWPLKDNCKA